MDIQHMLKQLEGVFAENTLRPTVQQTLIFLIVGVKASS